MEYGLSLGSNLEDRLGNIRSACDMIADIDGACIIEQASIYETAPVDVPEAYKHLAFLNTVVIVETDLAPAALHEKLQEIEGALGRVRGKEQNAPRSIDIDMIYAEGVISDTATLILPHPRWSERRFVVEPLAEIRPDLVIDVGLGSVSSVLLSLTKDSGQ